MKKNIFFAFAALFAAVCTEACTPMPSSVTNIGTAAQLVNIQGRLDGKFKLTQNITVSNWQPLGNDANPFKGDLDGNGYQITINSFADVSTSGSSDFYGLFGYIEGGRVYNLKVKGPSAILEKSSSKHIHFGGIAGCLNGGYIVQCSVDAGLYGRTTGSATSSMVGGIVGSLLNYGVISNCYAVGGVGGSVGAGGTANVGGIAGAIVGTIRWCYATNEVAAGGPVNTSYKNVGGIVGFIGGVGPEHSVVRAGFAVNSSVAALSAPLSNVHKIVGNIASPAFTDLTGNYGHSSLFVTGTNPNNNNGENNMHPYIDWFWEGQGWSSTVWDLTVLASSEYPKLKFPPVIW